MSNDSHDAITSAYQEDSATTEAQRVVQYSLVCLDDSGAGELCQGHEEHRGCTSSDVSRNEEFEKAVEFLLFCLHVDLCCDLDEFGEDEGFTFVVV